MLKKSRLLRLSATVSAILCSFAPEVMSVRANPDLDPQVEASSATKSLPTNPKVRRYGRGLALDTEIKTVSGDAETALVEHLVKIGAKFYGAYWCSHCTKQKSLFGAVAATKLPYIECAKDGQNSQRELCKKIQMFPTWSINGELFQGTRELKDIASASGYNGPMNFKYRK